MPHATPHVIEITDQSFGQDVLQRSHELPVVVDFWAPWCGPCRALGPVLEELAEAGSGDWLLAKINTDAHPMIAQQLDVRGIPAVKAFIDGELVDEFTGALPRPQIVSWLERLIPSRADKLLAQAHQALERENPEEAKRSFQATLAEDEGSPEALLGLARLALDDDEPDRARDLLAQIPEGRRALHQRAILALDLLLQANEQPQPLEQLRERIEQDPTDLEARHTLGVQLAARGAFEEGLEELLQIVIRDRLWGDDQARETMVEIFEIIGLNDPLTRTWQKKLGRAMY